MNKEFLNKLISTPSPVGQEDKLQELIMREFKDSVDDFILDNQGGLTSVYNKDADFKVMLVAHADEISLVVNGYNSDGTLRVTKNGGIRNKIYLGSKVRITLEDKIIYGVVGFNDSILSKEKVDDDNLFIDFGSFSEEESKEKVPLGSYIILDTDIREMENNLLAGRAFDDRSGTYVVQLAAQKAKELGASIGIYATSSVGEENTGRGAYSSASIINPDLVIVVDVTYASDSHNSDADGDIRLGRGGVICKGSIPNRKLNKMLEETAKELNEPVQFEVWPGRTATDGDTILKTHEACPQVLFSIPLRYMHSPIETISTKDLDSMVNVLSHLLLKLNKNIDFKPYKKILK